jgi:uncharacterized protein (UPF0335 family)
MIKPACSRIEIVEKVKIEMDANEIMQDIYGKKQDTKLLPPKIISPQQECDLLGIISPKVSDSQTI